MLPLNKRRGRQQGRADSRQRGRRGRGEPDLRRRRPRRPRPGPAAPGSTAATGSGSSRRCPQSRGPLPVRLPDLLETRGPRPPLADPDQRPRARPQPPQPPAPAAVAEAAAGQAEDLAGLAVPQRQHRHPVDRRGRPGVMQDPPVAPLPGRIASPALQPRWQRVGAGQDMYPVFLLLFLRFFLCPGQHGMIALHPADPTRHGRGAIGQLRNRQEHLGVDAELGTCLVKQQIPGRPWPRPCRSAAPAVRPLWL